MQDWHNQRLASFPKAVRARNTSGWKTAMKDLLSYYRKHTVLLQGNVNDQQKGDRGLRASHRSVPTWQTFSLSAAPPPRSPCSFLDTGSPWSCSMTSSLGSLGLRAVLSGIGSPLQKQQNGRPMYYCRLLHLTPPSGLLFV